MKILLTIALYGVLAGLLATQPRADDIDIYRDAGGAGRGPIRVMFALDLRAEGADIICVDAAAVDCRARLGDELYQALDLWGPAEGNTSSAQPENSGDGVADRLQASPQDSTASMAAAHWPGASVDRYEVLRAALRVVLENLGQSLRDNPAARRVAVGLMAMHGDDCPGAGPRYSPDYSVTPPRGCSQGAYLLRGFTDIADPDELQQLLVALAALPDPGRRAPWMTAPWRGHPYKIRDVYLELQRYLSGQAVFNGFLGTRDYGSGSSGNLYHSAAGAVTNDVLLTLPDGSAGQPLLAPATDILQPDSFDLGTNATGNARYRSPIAAGEACACVTLVHLQFGTAAESRADTLEAIAAPHSEGGLDLGLAPGVPGDRRLVAHLAATGVLRDATDDTSAFTRVKSYFFTRDANATSDTLAVAGGTGRAYSLADPRRLVADLESVFADAGGDSRSLVAASTLVNDRGRSRAGQDVFFTLFQPAGRPRWPGNIKKLKIVESGAGQPGVTAQAPLTNPPNAAISPEDGLILPDALTFWTDPAGDDVLQFDPDRGEVPGRDGRSVTRGGAGQQIRGYLSNAVGAGNNEPGARQVFTLDPARPGELLPLDATPATASTLGPLIDPAGQLSEEQRLQLLRWIRGQDGLDVDADGDRRESRPWVLADPLHSRPLAVSYGARPGSSYSLDNPDVRLFFGTNDGVFHVVRNTWPSGAESGQESWAFVPPDMLGRQHRLARNRAAGVARPYGLDGEAIALITDRNRDGTINPGEGDKVWVFIGQRRGGRGLLALDMTDPDRPRYLWTIDHRTPGFEQLALTFSTPRIARLDLGQSVPVPVLVFAGGYNGGWAGDGRAGKDAGGGADPAGNAIYVVNPADGSLLWRAVGPAGGETPLSGAQIHLVAGLEHSIPSPLSLLDSDHNGVDDRGYFGDSGGNLWRIDFTEAAYRSEDSGVTGPDNWYLSRLATLGGSGASDRRFFHAPDVVQSKDGSGRYDGVVITSGNRASPLETRVENFAYLVKDRRRAGAREDASTTPYTHNQLVDITGGCEPGSGSDCVADDLVAGWKLQLQSPGEKGLSTPLVSAGTVYFTTYVPATESVADRCTHAEGSSRAYAVSLADGTAALPGPGSLTLEEEEEEEPLRHLELGPGMAGDVVPYRDRILFPGLGPDEESLLSLPARNRWRAYWREEGVDEI